MKALALCLILWAAPLAAQDITPADIPRGQPDYHAAEAGTYRLDPAHSAVLVRVPHMGFSVSVFRFDTVSAVLEWDPGDPASNRLTAEVDPASVSTPVEGFAETLRGTEYLNVAAFPTAGFKASRFTAESATTGKVEGYLSIMGRVRPATFDARLIGAGQGYTGDGQGNPVIRNLIGFHAETTIDPQQYGLNAFFTDPMVIQIDAEFVKED